MSVSIPHAQDEQLAFTRGVIHLLEDWGLQVRDMIAVLALPESVKVRNFARFLDDTPFPDDPEVMRRAEYIVKIADALRTSYPRNPYMRSRWMQQQNRHLGRRAPLAVILDDGESGLVRVLAQLDCTFAWDLTGSKGC